MSKLKTHRGAAKRFRVRKSGSIKCRHSCRSHLMTAKSTKVNRKGNQSLTFVNDDSRRALELLQGY